MRRAAIVLAFILIPAALWAGFGLGRPAAVKRRVDKLDDKVRAEQLRKAPAVPASTNRAPTFSSLVAVSTKIAAGGLSAVSVSASDPDGDALSYLWTSTAGVFGGSGSSVYWLAPSTPGVYSLSCSVSDGSVSVSSSTAVAAVTAGTVKWKFTTSSPVLLPPAAASDGGAYAADASGKVYALTAAGAQRWVFTSENTDNINYNPVTASDGTVYVVAAGTKAYALNSDGTLKWGPEKPAPNNIDAPPVVGQDGKIYVFDSLAAAVYVMDPATGVSVATFTALPGIAQPPVIGKGGAICLVDTADNLYFVPPAGLAAATTTVVTGISRAPAVAPDGTVYWTDTDTNLNALTPAGAVKWSPYTPGCSVNSAIVAGRDGTAYFIDSCGSLNQVSGATGSGGAIPGYSPGTSLPGVSPDGTVYVTDSGNSLYSLTPAGVVKWGPLSPDAPATAISAPPAAAADGTLYFGTDDTAFYAVYGASALP